MNNKELGNYGEKCAANFLKLKGYKILEKNYLKKTGEIDLIAMDKKTLVFIEVKTRRSELYGSPADAVNYYKRQHIINTAKLYIHTMDKYDIDVRFDVIEVYLSYNKTLMLPKINHIKEAFI